MTYHGYVKDGVVVLDERVTLPEGTRVACLVVTVAPFTKGAATESQRPPVEHGIMEFAGKAVGLPEDASANLDHYLYGHSKR